MAKLENQGQRGLPPPPAPPRRSANPWNFSETGRKREAPPPRPEEEEAAQLLEELFSGKAGKAGKADGTRKAGRQAEPMATPQPKPLAPPAPPAGQNREPRNPWKSARKHGLLPLIVLLIVVGVIVKLATEVMETGEWRKLIPALFVLFFLAQGWLRSRKKDERGGEDGA